MSGKQKLAKYLLPIIHGFEHSCYVETFAGGAAMLFMRNPANTQIINDINAELTNLYRCVKHYLTELVCQFKWMLVAREKFDDFMTLPLRPRPISSELHVFLFAKSGLR